jgi:hypothetical protein
VACPFPPGNGFAFSRNPGGLRLRRRKNVPNPSLTKITRLIGRMSGHTRVRFCVRIPVIRRL